MASDGQYLYILTKRGLFKLGSGYGGTLMGYVYSQNTEYFTDKFGWLGCAHVSIILSYLFIFIHCFEVNVVNLSLRLFL